MPTRQPSTPASLGNKHLTRRALLNAAATLPFAPLAARAQNTDSLWDSALIMIGSGGTLIGTDRVQCALFDLGGKPSLEERYQSMPVRLQSRALSTSTGRFREGNCKPTFGFRTRMPHTGRGRRAPAGAAVDQRRTCAEMLSLVSRLGVVSRQRFSCPQVRASSAGPPLLPRSRAGKRRSERISLISAPYAPGKVRCQVGDSSTRCPIFDLIRVLRNMPRRRNLWVTDTLQWALEARLAQPANPMWDSAELAFPVRSHCLFELICALR